VLHVLMLPDFERADRIGEFWGYPESGAFAELLIDCEEDRTLRAVLGRDAAGGGEVAETRTIFSQRRSWPKHIDAMTQEDPGWRPKWYLLIPLVGELMRGRAERTQTTVLVGLRSIFLRHLISLFLFLWAFRYIAPWDGGDERWVPWTIAATGVYALVATAWVRRRPLVTGSAEALAGSYRANFYVGLGLAVSPALFGLCGVFIGDSLWVYLVGLAFTLVALWMIAPTRQNIERRQREITAAGSPLSLLDALTAVSPS
jgi:hypothetical protein